MAETFMCVWCFNNVTDYVAKFGTGSVCQRCVCGYANYMVKMYRIPDPSLMTPGGPSYIDPGLIHDPATRNKFQSWIDGGVRLKESRPCRRVDCKGRVPSDNICDECGCRQNPRRVRTFVDSVLHFHYDQCPMCGEVAVKIDGCSSVTCPVCKTHYSYQNLSIARPLDRV